MADREKLIELLYHAPCESDLEGRPGSCPYRKHGRCGEVERLDLCAVHHLADHLIANGVVISNSEITTDKDNNVPRKWIPVTERLPEPGERVLVCIGAVFEAFIDDGGKWQRYYSAPLNEVLGEPTHWMPLPEPPKGE